MPSSNDNLNLGAQKLAAATHLAVITGAGVSKESGIPTFRGKEGYWKKHRPEELATPAAFQRNPELVHEWYGHRRTVCGQAEPNPAHLAIAELEKLKSGFLLITQNVDGLHRRAGSQKLIEIHGNIFRLRCISCAYHKDYSLQPDSSIALECPQCHGLVRPDIVWFGESYNPDHLQQSFTFLQNCDLVLVVGTSGLVPIPLHLAGIAKRSGAFIIDINPEVSEISQIADLHIALPAGEALPQLLGDM